MSKQNDRKALIEGVTNEILKDKLIQEMGHKAIVDRTKIENNERTDALREVIGDVAKDLQEIGQVPRGMNYCGSLSVHVFKSVILGEAAFATINNIGSLDVALADGALRELTGTTMEFFGKPRQKRRSGF